MESQAKVTEMTPLTSPTEQPPTRIITTMITDAITTAATTMFSNSDATSLDKSTKTFNEEIISVSASSGDYRPLPDEANLNPFSQRADKDEDSFFSSDVWVAAFLVLLVLVCIGYIFSCILYHKFKKWKRQVLASQLAMENRPSIVEEYYPFEESLPSYTIVTGLPSYDEAMEQLRQLRTIRRFSTASKIANVEENLEPPKITFARLSLGEIFQFYKLENNVPE